MKYETCFITMAYETHFLFFFFFQANGYSFINIDHGQAVSLLKTFQNAVELIIVREVSS